MSPGPIRPALVPAVMFALMLTLAGCGTSEHASARAAAPPAPGEVVLGPTSPKLRYLSVEPVALRGDRVVAVLPAQLVMNENHSVRVFSPVTGRITSVLTELGAQVTRGTALARITSSDAAQASSDLARATAAAAQTSASLARAQDLYAHHIIALKDLEVARSDQAQGLAELARARSRTQFLGTGPTPSGDFVLRAPIGGIVVDRSANPGAEVRPDAQVPLFSISDLSTLWLVASVPQRDLPHARRGDRLSFTTDAAPGRTFVGTISYVGDALDPQTRTAILRAVLPDPTHTLRPMTSGEARLLTSDTSAAPGVAVPTMSLVTRGPAMMVFVETIPGHFQKRIVTVADDDGITATISSGLAPGERVVTRGALLLASEGEQ